MKNQVKWTWLQMVLLCIALPLWSQEIDFTIRYNSTDNLYEVYGQSDFSQDNFFVGGGSQLSIVLPASIADETLVINTVTGGPWTDNSQVYAPAITPSQDYHGIATNGTPMNWVTGVETLLFTFTIPSETCVPGIRLFENGVDPSSSEPSMNGSDFKNFFANVLTFTDHYRANYYNLGLTCMPLQESIDTLVTITEDSAITVCFPMDLEEGSTSIELCQVPHNGTAMVNANGQNELCLTYTPDANFNGLDTVCLTYCNPLNVCDSITVIINVVPVNDPPSIDTIPTITLPEDSMITVCTNFLDVDLGDSFTESICGGPSNGTATLSIIENELCLTYIPTEDYNGLDEVCITICDQSGDCDSITVSIIITPVDEPIVNDPPIIDPVGPIVLPEDSTITVCSDIIDADASDTFQGFICEEPENGSATISIINNAVCITYTPTSNYNGQDEVCITVCDSAGACDSIDIPIVITPVDELVINDPPVIDPINPFSIPEDSTASVCTTFEDINPLDVFQAFVCGGPENGTATVNIVDNFLCLLYTPVPNFNGQDIICISVCDQVGDCDSIEVPIMVTPIEEPEINHPPILATVPPYTTQEEESIFQCIPFSDPNINDQFMASVCDAPDNGSVDISIVNDELCFVYTPTPNFVGNDRFCLVLCDQAGACDSTTITITVLSGATPGPTNDPPIITAINPYTIPSDKTVTLCTPFSDPNIGDTFSAAICNQPTLGAAALIIDGNELCITYSALPNNSGTDILCISVCDQLGACDELAITVNVTASNTPPKIEPIEIDSVSEGNQLIACYPFSDPDIADTFTGQLCSGTINGQANLSIQGNELCLEYIPNSNFVGKENICIQVCDQAGACDSITVPINIYASTNTPPSIQAIPSSEIHADSTLLLCTTFDDPDIGDNHIIELCDEPNNGEASIEFSGNEICVRYIPNASFEGTENICLSVCDQENACDEIRIPITITQPTLSCETLFADISVQESISGCSGTDIELFVSNGSADFQYEWFTSNNNSVGTGSTVLLENVSVVDAGSYYVQISYENCISEINDPRFLTDLQVIPPSKGIAQTVGYLETCGTSIELEAIQSDGEEGYWASLNENTIAQIEAPNQPLTKVQNLQEGSNLFTWTLVTDECTPTTVDTLEIYVYETPIASDDAFSVAFNTPIGLDLIQNDLYSEDSLNIYIVSDLEHGQAMRNGKGLYTYTPEQNYVGTKSFIYKICNPICPDLCTEATVTLTIGANADCITGGLVTPNDDGFNDTFIVPCLVNHEGSALTIFNRYGDEVYHSLNYNNTWDGTYKGNPLPAGTYYYILAINDEVGTVINDYLFLQR